MSSSFGLIFQIPQAHMVGRFLACATPLQLPRESTRSKIAQRKISKSDQHKARATRACERFAFRVMQWLVLCGIPYRGSGVRFPPPQLTQRTGFPRPSFGAGPNGHREAPLLNQQLFKNSTSYSLLQLTADSAGIANRDFSRITTPLPECNPAACGKAVVSVGNGRSAYSIRASQ
jgi:hypothetical protein